MLNDIANLKFVLSNVEMVNPQVELVGHVLEAQVSKRPHISAQPITEAAQIQWGYCSPPRTCGMFLDVGVVAATDGLLPCPGPFNSSWMSFSRW